MSGSLALIIGSLAILQLKHFVCDFLLQNEYQLTNKANYGHPGGVLHAGVHSLASLPAVLLFGPPAALVGAIVIGEFVAHYHLDWLKGRIDRRYHWTTTDRPYWAVFGADQLLHQITYVAIVAVLAFPLV